MSAAASTCRLTIRFHLAWWLKAWIYSCVVINHLTCWAPSEAACNRIIRRGMYVEQIK